MNDNEMHKMIENHYIYLQSNNSNEQDKLNYLFVIPRKGLSRKLT